jgi:hypothetical protein
MHMMAQLKDIRAQVFKAKKCISPSDFSEGLTVLSNYLKRTTVLLSELLIVAVPQAY